MNLNLLHRIRAKGVRVESLARIQSMSEDGIVFI